MGGDRGNVAGSCWHSTDGRSAVSCTICFGGITDTSRYALTPNHRSRAFDHRMVRPLASRFMATHLAVQAYPEFIGHIPQRSSTDVLGYRQYPAFSSTAALIMRTGPVITVGKEWTDRSRFRKRWRITNSPANNIQFNTHRY